MIYILLFMPPLPCCLFPLLKHDVPWSDFFQVSHLTPYICKPECLEMQEWGRWGEMRSSFFSFALHIVICSWKPDVFSRYISDLLIWAQLSVAKSPQCLSCGFQSLFLSVFFKKFWSWFWPSPEHLVKTVWELASRCRLACGWILICEVNYI